MAAWMVPLVMGAGKMMLDAAYGGDAPQQPNQLRNFNIAPVQQAPQGAMGTHLAVPDRMAKAPQQPPGYQNMPHLQQAIAKYLGQGGGPPQRTGVGRHIQGGKGW